MDKQLRLQILLAGIDKLSAPLDRITGGSKRLSRGLAATRKEVTQLQQAQAKLGAFKDAEAKYRASAAALETVRAKTAGLRKEIAGIEAPTRRMAAALARAEDVEAKLATRHDEQGRALQGLSHKLEASGMDVAELGRHEDRLAGKLSAATGKMKAQQDELARLSRAQAGAAKLDRMGGSLRSGGARVATAGVAAVAALALPVKSTAEFESQMTDIGLKASLTRAQVTLMGKRFDALAPKVAQLPSDLAKGVDTLAGLGLDPRMGEKMIAPIGRAATAYKAEVTDLASSTFATIDNLKVAVGQTAKTLDVMAAAGKAGAFEIKDMAQYFPALTASAQALGQKGVPAVADLAAALQITRKGAGSSEAAATNLQNLLNKINTEDTIANFKQFGVDLPAAMKKAAKDGKTPIEAIAELTRKATGGDLSKLSFLFGDAQVQAALRPLISNMELYRKIRADALAANGTVEADFAGRMGDAAAKMQRLKGVAQGVGHQMGAVLLPHATALMDKVSDLGEKFGTWAQRNPALAATLAKVAAGAALLLLVAGGLSMLLGGLAFVFSPLIGVFARLAPLFITGAKGARTAGIAIRVLGVAFRFMLGPIGLAITIIGLLGYAIYSNWDTIKAAFASGVAFVLAKWTAFKAMFMGGLAFVIGLGARFAQAGGNLITGLINGFMSKVGALKSRIVGLAGDVKNWFANALGIRSPSRVFMGLGGFLTKGLAIGVDRGSADPLARVRALAGRMATAMAIGAATPALAGTAGVRFVGGETAAPRAAAAASAAAANASRAPIVIEATFHLHGVSAGDAPSIEAAVKRALADARREADAAARSAYVDD